MVAVETDRRETVAAAFQAGENIYRGLGSPLYALLCAKSSEEPDIIALGCYAQEGAGPIHLFACVHFLLLRDPSDPFSRFFPTLTDKPEPPEQAFPEFVRYCREHREEIQRLLQTRTVQTTYVQRCGALVPPLSVVAADAGEPLNLVEIGCSAGILLTFDKYAYDFNGRKRIGSAEAPLVISQELKGGPDVRIPKIGMRTGIDLHTVDAKSEEDRRWILALSFPELRDEQVQLARALVVVAQTDIRFLQGNALELLPKAIDETRDPLCVFHSACVFYWNAEAKAALEGQLVEASRNRVIYRVALEPSDSFNAWTRGRGGDPNQSSRNKQPSGEVTIGRYHRGSVERRVVAHNSADYSSLDWIG